MKYFLIIILLTSLSGQTQSFNATSINHLRDELNRSGITDNNHSDKSTKPNTNSSHRATESSVDVFNKGIIGLNPIKF